MKSLRTLGAPLPLHASAVGHQPGQAAGPVELIQPRAAGKASCGTSTAIAINPNVPYQPQTIFEQRQERAAVYRPNQQSSSRGESEPWYIDQVKQPSRAEARARCGISTTPSTSSRVKIKSLEESETARRLRSNSNPGPTSARHNIAKK